MLRESASMGLVASATGRIGATQCEASMWASTSELQCKAPRGVRGSQTLAVTAGMRARSLTTTMTFDVNRVSASTGGNAATTGAVFLTIAGSGYGTSAGTPGSRAGKSSCESTKWVAESSMVCRQASGVAGSRSIQVSMGETVGSVTEVRSYDMERVSATGRSNGPGGVGGAAGALTRRSVVVSGGGMGHTATSGRAQVGASSCEASIWQSESAVVCYAGVVNPRQRCRRWPYARLAATSPHPPASRQTPPPPRVSGKANKNFRTGSLLARPDAKIQKRR